MKKLSDAAVSYGSRPIATSLVNGKTLTLAGFAAAIAYPLLDGNLYNLQLFTEIIIISLLALSLNILIGYTGLVSLGHAAFLGIGAYASTLAMQHVYPSIWAGLTASVLSAGIVALAIGVFCIRLSGLYFAMITLAFSQAFYTIAFYWDSVTGGDDGLIGIPRPDISLFGLTEISIDGFVGYYYFTLVIVALAAYLMWRILNSPFGAILKAIRENPERVEFLGLPVYRYKLAAFIISAAFGGLAGGLFAPFQGFISPELLYWTKSGETVLMTILGGIHSFLGPAVGATVLIFLRDTVLNYTEYWKIIVGSILILCVLFAPGGIVGFITARLSEIFKGASK
ncbi:branched-chain amino acid ABC transporter permease [Nitratireductor sp. XY-223]|uniref:branched-chain amino acid ABC transporter permease n=1 Tax=Nitratireductor sp. XY-223 TaxID=2561926 RepID=UPI0010AA7520|nr:branched-chain amino acid ABC transporter permease [Nitratireductor sp. XY-223]